MDGEPWFPAKDVCDALGVNNPREAVRYACEPAEFKQVSRSSVILNDVSFPNRGMLCVNESGLYALIFKSRKAEAEAFRYWVRPVSVGFAMRHCTQQGRSERPSYRLGFTAPISRRPRQMGNALTTFDFNSNSIRVADIDGDPWFNAHDVVQVLGIRNTANAIRPLAGDETSVYRMNTSGRPSRIISESGLYKLTMRSDKPEARVFQDWVTRVVLPAIRKDGAYIAGEEKLAAGELSEDALCFWGQKSERLTIYT